MTKVKKPALLKAYHVSDEDDWADIVYARHAIGARRMAASEHGDGPGEIGGVICSRAAWADQYAPGPVPDLAKIDHGWWVECSGCGIRIDSDCAGTDADDNPVELHPIEVSSGTFCTVECHQHEFLRRHTIKKLEHEAIEHLARDLFQKMPGATIDGKPHAYVTADKSGALIPHQVTLHFRYPGCKIGPAGYGFNKPGEEPTCMCCAGDKDAFEAWRAAGYLAVMPEVVRSEAQAA